MVTVENIRYYCTNKVEKNNKNQILSSAGVVCLLPTQHGGCHGFFCQTLLWITKSNNSDPFTQLSMLAVPTCQLIMKSFVLFNREELLLFLSDPVAGGCSDTGRYTLLTNGPVPTCFYAIIRSIDADGKRGHKPSLKLGTKYNLVIGLLSRKSKVRV